MDIQTQLTELLSNILSRPATDFNADTRLLGEMPDFDSMALMLLLTEVSQSFSLDVQDAGFDSETFYSVATLSDFIKKAKANA